MRQSSGIPTSRRHIEKINPAYFDKSIKLLKMTITNNALGEEVRSYNEEFSFRAMISPTEASMEDITKHSHRSFKSVIKLWCHYDHRLIDTTSKIEHNGVIYDIDSVAEVFGRKRYINIKAISFL
jgi:head-tail adaptor